MRVWKHGCDVTLSVFPGTIRKHFRAFARLKVISSTNIKEMEKNLPNFDLGLGYLFPPKPKEKKAKERHVLKEKHNAA